MYKRQKEKEKCHCYLPIVMKFYNILDKKAFKKPRSSKNVNNKHLWHLESNLFSALQKFKSFLTLKIDFESPFSLLTKLIFFDKIWAKILSDFDPL